MAQIATHPVDLGGFSTFTGLTRSPFPHQIPHQSVVPSSPHVLSNSPGPPHAPSKSTKRRLEDDDTEAMERSPTPERPMARRMVPKRLRVAGGRGEGADNDSRHGSAEKDDVDVGVLLGEPHHSLS